MSSIDYSSDSETSSIYTIGTKESLNTENLLNSTYPYYFLNNLLEFKVQQKRYTQHDIFNFVEEYLNIDLKNIFNCIEEESCYKENYNLLLTSIFSCVASLLINDCQDRILIQKVIDTMAESFSEIVDMYCSFNINKKFYDKYFNVNNNSKNVKKEIEGKIEKNDILHEIDKKDNFENKNINSPKIINQNDDILEKNNCKKDEEDIIKKQERINNIYDYDSSPAFSNKNLNIIDNEVTNEEKKEKKCPEKKIKKDIVDDIYEKIKNTENIYIEKECNNDIINNIKDIKLKKIDKYMLMIKLYEKLLEKEITEAKQFTKYIKDMI